MSRGSIVRVIRRFFCASYLVVLALCWPYADVPSEAPNAALLFAWAVLLSYAAIYLAPAWLLTSLVALVVSSGTSRLGVSRGRRSSVWTVAVASASLTGFVLFLDRSIYEVFGFHLNGFVWTLLLTPGGLDSLVASEQAELRGALTLLGLFALHGFILFACLECKKGRLAADKKLRERGVPWLLGTWVALLLVQALAYAASQLCGYRPVVVSATRFPGYQPLTIARLAERWGFDPERAPGIGLGGTTLALSYPARLRVQDPAALRPNMVWLVIESLRADALTSEIMPHTSALAARSLTSARHYSGGNGTRMGTFSLFYGLYGSYWFPFLDERRPPLLMDALEQRGYRVEAWSSAGFSSPELDRTVFARLPAERLHASRDELSRADGDRALVRGLEAALERRDAAQPFAAFVFFQGTHSPSDAVREVDRRVGEVVELLARLGLDQETLLLVTGDHGAELPEHGHLRHCSSFCDEQVLVPFVLHVPGREPLRLERITSHLDVAPTILRLLGYQQPPELYSLGFDLFGPGERAFTVVSSWTELCWIDAQYKIALPYRGPDLLGVDVCSSADEPVDDRRSILVDRSPALADLLRGMARFGNADRAPP